jgi:uncharacterized protein
MATWLGLVRCELYVPGARSLKDKRRAVKSLVDKMHARFRVSVAETGLHDLHQRAEISIAAVAGTEADVEHLMDSLRAMADDLSEALIAHWDSQILHAET